MNKNFGVFSLILPMVFAGCTSLPPVNQSREVLWQKYANKSIDEVLMTMGTPARESKLTDGSRLITYQYSSIYDSGSPYQYDSGCEVTFLSKTPGFKIKDIAMQGGNYECSLLAQGRTGVVRHPYIAPPTPYAYPAYR